MYQQPTTETLRVETINAVLGESMYGDNITEGDGDIYP